MSRSVMTVLMFFFLEQLITTEEKKTTCFDILSELSLNLKLSLRPKMQAI